MMPRLAAVCAFLLTVMLAGGALADCKSDMAKAQASIDAGRFEEAAANFNKVLNNCREGLGNMKYDEIMCIASFYIAMSYDQLQTIEKAKPYADLAVKRCPDNAWAYYVRARANFKNGQFEDTINDASAAKAKGYSDVKELEKLVAAAKAKLAGK